MFGLTIETSRVEALTEDLRRQPPEVDDPRERSLSRATANLFVASFGALSLRGERDLYQSVAAMEGARGVLRDPRLDVSVEYRIRTLAFSARERGLSVAADYMRFPCHERRLQEALGKGDHAEIVGAATAVFELYQTAFWNCCYGGQWLRLVYDKERFARNVSAIKQAANSVSTEDGDYLEGILPDLVKSGDEANPMLVEGVSWYDRADIEQSERFLNYMRNLQRTDPSLNLGNPDVSKIARALNRRKEREPLSTMDLREQLREDRFWFFYMDKKGYRSTEDDKYVSRTPRSLWSRVFRN